MSGTFVDFAAIKERVKIEQVITMLGVPMKLSSSQYRGACPHCRAGGDRALAVTPSKNSYYCFAASAGGDVIGFVSHIRGISARDAAQELAEHFGISTVPSGTGTVRKEGANPSPAPASEGFKPLDYLDASHEAVEAVGFPVEVAEAIGLGFAPKGLLRGLVAIPIRLPDGTLTGYVGVSEAKLPSKWHGIPETNVVPLKKPA